MMGRRRVLPLVVIAGLLVLSGAAWSEEALIRVDCREGTGMVPTAWRALSVRPGHDHLNRNADLRAVSVSSEFVRQAWEDPSQWPELVARLKGYRARRLRVLLSLPFTVDGAEGIEPWVAKVRATVDRLKGQEILFELGDGSGSERIEPDVYLEAYESAAWAIYRTDSAARIGGPGTNGRSDIVEALARRCKERRLPLHFLSWRVASQSDTDIQQSVDAAADILDRHPQEQSTELVLSEWTAPDLEAGLTSLMALQSDRLDLACVRAPASAGFQAFEQLGAVRLAPISEDGSPVRAVATMAGEELRSILWTTSPSVNTVLQLAGLPPGRRAEVRSRVVGSVEAEVVETVSHTEPLEVELLVRKGYPVEVHVQID